MATKFTEEKGDRAVVPAIISTAIAAIFVVFRWVSRYGVVHNVGADDALIIGSLVFSIAFAILLGFQRHYGLGRHITMLEPESLAQMNKAGIYIEVDQRMTDILAQFFYASIPIYNLSLTFTKISILLLYRRIFIGYHTRVAINILLCIIVLYGLSTFWSAIFTCYPIQKFWIKAIEGGYCINRMPLWFANAAMNIATDLMILVCPMPILKTLHLPRRQKFGLIAIFAVGFFACITSILRLHALYEISISEDVTWDNVGAGAWSSVEVNVAIICACLPTLKPLIVRMFPGLLGSSRRETGSAGPIGGSNRDRNARVFPLADGSGTKSAVGSTAPGSVGKSSHHPLDSKISIDDFIHSNNPRVFNAWNGSGSDIPPVCGRGEPGDTGSVINGQIKVVTRIAQDVEVKKSESEAETKSVSPSRRSETSSERRLWEGVGMEHKGM